MNLIKFNFPKRYWSPFHILLSCIILITISFNVGLYKYESHSIPSYVSEYSHGENYQLNSDTKLQIAVDKVDSEEFLKSLMEDMKNSKQAELMAKLKNEVKEEYQGKILDDLKKSIEEQYTDQFKEELKQKVNSEFTQKVFREREMTFSVFNDLKFDYLLKNKEEIKKYAFLETFKDLLEKNPELSSSEVKEKLEGELNSIIDRKHFYSSILKELLIANGPKSAPLSNKERGRDVGGRYYRDVQEPPLSRDELLDGHVELNEEKFIDFQKNHDNLVKSLKNLEDPPREFINGDGIVISGGGIYFGGALVTIGQIREMGSKLPIELVINTEEEYDKQICEELLPEQFNAKCVVIEREIGEDLLKELNLQKFQMKILALFVSSFDNIIALDADNMPLKNVDTLLTSEPFLSSKFILWPDIWHKATSPIFYEIARLKFGEPVHREGIANDWDYFEYIKKDKNKEISLHDLEGSPPAMSVETGQLVFSKRKHFNSFLLALYYNIYGYSHYYRLLFQGTPGEGDRETFIPALHVFNEPYHLVKHDVWLAGYKEGEKQDGRSQETTIVQYDPLQSIKFFKDWKDWLANVKKMDTRLWPFQGNPWSINLFNEFKRNKVEIKEVEEIDDEGNKINGKKEIPYKLPDVFFLHVHKPKINPILNAATDGNYGIYTRRNLGLHGYYFEQLGKTDWELKFHSISKWIACNGIKSESFWNNVAKMKQAEVCQKASDYVEFLKKDSKDIKSGELKYLKG